MVHLRIVAPHEAAGHAAELRHVFVRSPEGGKAPIPDSVRAALEPFTAG